MNRRRRRILGGFNGGSSIRIINIASAMRMAGNESGGTSNGTDTAHNSIKWVKNESGVEIDNIQVVYPGWRVDAGASGTETDNNGNLTVTCAVQYPSGTRTQVLFGGSATGTVVAGQLYQSDKLTLSGASKIPAGAWFAIHTFVTCSAGVRWPTIKCANNFNGGTTENTENGTAGVLTDKTMSGAPSGTGAGYFPCLILSNVTGKAGVKKTVLGIIGDSIAAGAADDNFDTSNNTSFPARAATGRCPVVHCAATGTDAESNATAFSKRVSLMKLGGVTHCLMNYGSNDLSSGRSAAQLQADYLTMAAALAAEGIQVVNYTVIPRLSNSTPNTFRQSTQTLAGAGFTAGTGSVRHTYNTWVRSNPAGVYDYIETANLVDVDISNVPTAGGGYLITGPITNLDQPYNATFSGVPTTTVIQTDIIKASNYFASFAGSRILFTSGANNGVFATISSSNASGQITLASALASAPVAGDTGILYTNRIAPTNDGVHPSFADNANQFGGVLVLKKPLEDKIDAWNV